MPRYEGSHVSPKAALILYNPISYAVSKAAQAVGLHAFTRIMTSELAMDDFVDAFKAAVPISILSIIAPNYTRGGLDTVFPTDRTRRYPGKVENAARGVLDGLSAVAVGASFVLGGPQTGLAALGIRQLGSNMLMDSVNIVTEAGHAIKAGFKKKK